MPVDYTERPEMVSMSKEVRALYFAAVAVIEDLERLAEEDVLYEMEQESLDRLQRAIEGFQGEELANGNPDKD